VFASVVDEDAVFAERLFAHLSTAAKKGRGGGGDDDDDLQEDVTRVEFLIALDAR
jgi:hypothetical protein